MPSRLAAIAIVVSAALLAGCGSSADEGSPPSAGTRAPSSPSSGAPVGGAARSCAALAADAEALRATGVPCDRARQVLHGWQREPACALPASGSRGGCLIRSYRCQAVRADRGIAVSCARAGESVAFLAQRD